MSMDRATTEEIMARIVGRITAIADPIRGLALGVAILAVAALSGVNGYAQSPATPAPPKPAAPATYSGCVQKAPGLPDTLVISTPTVCAMLKGKLFEDKVAGHEIELKGVLTPRNASVAASIEVQSVVSVGKSCSDVCSLHPPATRGLHPPKTGEIPGSEGGTPGAPHQ
jgi:hypothetical protein